MPYIFVPLVYLFHYDLFQMSFSEPENLICMLFLLEYV